MADARFRFHVHGERLAIARLDAEAPVPAWARGSFVTVSRTPDELSVVCAERHVPEVGPAAGPASGPAVPQAVERGKVALGIEGTVPMTTIGVLAALCAALASARVSVFAISTYDTDWLLVSADRLQDARAALESLGHTVRGEPPAT